MLIIDTLKDEKRFTFAEMAVVRYVLEYPRQVIGLTVEQLANASYSSPSSVVRVCKKVGMHGFSDFKIKLATEINTFTTDSKRIELDIPITKGANINDVAKTMLNLHYQALSDVYNNIDLAALQKAADLIEQADIVTIYAKGESLLIAQSFKFKLFRIRINAYCESLHGYQRVRYKRKKMKEVAIIITQFADSKETNLIFEQLQKTKVPTILICANKTCAIAKLSDVVIFFDNSETLTKMGSFASRTSMQFIADSIYCAVFCKNYDENIGYLKEYGIFSTNYHEYFGDDR